MMGGGGAMMLWRLAWLQAFPMDSRGLAAPYTPAIPPMARDKVTRENRGSWRYYQLIDAADHLASFPQHLLPCRTIGL